MSLKGKANLTPRETEVLKLIADGLPNKGIAVELGISIKTVEKHRQQVMNKLNIHEVAGLTRHAVATRMTERSSVTAVSPAVQVQALQGAGNSVQRELDARRSN